MPIDKQLKKEPDKRWRQNNKQKNEYGRQRIKKIQQWFKEYKSTLKCNRCGFSHPATLNFHHKDDNKEFNISKGVFRFTIERIKIEISKCEVLCANCHLILHYEEKNDNIVP